MKRFCFLITLFANLNLLNSQIYEVGIFTGGSNFIGDVGSTTFVSPEKLTYGGFYAGIEAHVIPTDSA